MGFLFGGNDSPPPAPAPPPPPPREELMDFFDEVGGVKSITVTGPDGKKRRVKQRLPRTPEEQRRYEVGEQMIAQSMQNIQELYQYNPGNVVDFAPLIQTFANIDEERMADLAGIANIGNIAESVQRFRDMHTSLNEERFRIENRELEESLARKGLSDSSAGREARAFAARDQGFLRQQADLMAENYGEDLASKRLARNSQTYALNETGREGRLRSAQGEYQLRRDQLSDIEARRQAAIAENTNNLNIGSGLVGQDLNKALGSQVDQLALGTFQAQNADSLNRYTAGVNAQNAAYDRQLGAYNSRPPSFGEMASRGLGALGGAVLTGSKDSLGGRIGARIF